VHDVHMAEHVWRSAWHDGTCSATSSRLCFPAILGSETASSMRPPGLGNASAHCGRRHKHEFAAAAAAAAAEAGASCAAAAGAAGSGAGAWLAAQLTGAGGRAACWRRLCSAKPPSVAGYDE
jgi:hypothetical protein